MTVHGEAGTRGAVKGVRPAYFPEPAAFVETTVYDRAKLTPGDEIARPGGGGGGGLDAGRSAPAAPARVAASGNIVVLTLPS